MAPLPDRRSSNGHSMLSTSNDNMSSSSEIMPNNSCSNNSCSNNSSSLLLLVKYSRYIPLRSLVGYAPGDRLRSPDDDYLFPLHHPTSTSTSTYHSYHHPFFFSSSSSSSSTTTTAMSLAASSDFFLRDAALALHPTDCAFVLRSNGCYTYATCEGRVRVRRRHDGIDDDGDEGGVSFAVDECGGFKVVSAGRLSGRVRVPVVDVE